MKQGGGYMDGAGAGDLPDLYLKAPKGYYRR
jgi:hypothetical protein